MLVLKNEQSRQKMAELMDRYVQAQAEAPARAWIAGRVPAYVQVYEEQLRPIERAQAEATAELRQLQYSGRNYNAIRSHSAEPDKAKIEAIQLKIDELQRQYDELTGKIADLNRFKAILERPPVAPAAEVEAILMGDLSLVEESEI